MTLWAFGLLGTKNFPQPMGSFYCIGGVIAFTACLKAVIWFGYFSYLWMSGRYFCVTTREKNDSEVSVDSKRVKAEVDFD
jgi:hypothetical protein